MIDLCPVGALTSKPFRYGARTWELSRRRSIAMHDALGSNVVVQIKHDKVMRVVPLENEAMNVGYQTAIASPTKGSTAQTV
jgi:NADH-quinone oxidoreductase subunit G